MKLQNIDKKSSSSKIVESTSSRISKSSEISKEDLQSIIEEALDRKFRILEYNQRKALEEALEEGEFDDEEVEDSETVDEIPDEEEVATDEDVLSDVGDEEDDSEGCCEELVSTLKDVVSSLKEVVDELVSLKADMQACKGDTGESVEGNEEELQRKKKDPDAKVLTETGSEEA